MAASKELYTILGVDETASDAEIRSAYEHLIANNPQGTPRYDEIVMAYTVLSDMDKRAMYDVTGKIGKGIKRTRRPSQGSRREKIRFTLNTVFLVGAVITFICFIMNWSGVWSNTPFYWTCGISMGIKVAEYILRLIP